MENLRRLIKRIFVFTTLCGVAPSNARMIDVLIRAHLPNHLNNIEALYISGDHSNLGSWKPNAVRLNKVTKNLWQTSISLPEAKLVEFKFTLGDWEHVETTNQNRDRPNRMVYCTESCTLNIEIENFRITPFHAKPKSANGRIEYYHEIYFQEQNNLRSMAVYLPPGYESSQNHYPVIYAMDGQNIFDSATATYGAEWNIDEIAELLISRKEIQPVIIVGLYSTEKRSEELLMNSAYANFLVYGIKPFIEERYRVKKGRSQAGILGSSFGGVFAFYGAWKYSEHFEKFAALSAAYWWGDFAIEKMVSKSAPVGSPLKLWMDMGNAEGGKFDNAVEEMMRTHSAIKKSFPGDLHMEVVKGGTHNEKSWGARVGQILKFLFPHDQKLFAKESANSMFSTSSHHRRKPVRDL